MHQFSDVEDGHPIARSSSPEQQVDNSRATTAGAVSRSTREGTTNCVTTASLRAMVAFVMAWVPVVMGW